jgi:hypothetical protein
MMLHFPCVSLTNLSRIVGERYDTRNRMIVRNRQNADLLTVENDIIRINKLITLHRRHCRHCKLREIRVSGMSQSRPKLTETHASQLKMITN